MTYVNTHSHTFALCVVRKKTVYMAVFNNTDSAALCSNCSKVLQNGMQQQGMTYLPRSKWTQHANAEYLHMNYMQQIAETK